MKATLLDDKQRLQVQARILEHLWANGACRLDRLAEALCLELALAEVYVDDLSARRYVYQLWPSPEGKRRSVYYLTERVRRRLHQEFSSYPRYRLQALWEALQLEQGGLPHVPDGSLAEAP